MPSLYRRPFWKSQKTPSFLAASLLVSLLVGAGLSGEPSYRGHSLYEWLSTYDSLDRSTPLRDRVLGWNTNGLNEAAAAVRQIGTNAIPSLLVWISNEPSSLRTNALQRVLSEDEARYLPRLAVFGFGLLRGEARQALPALARLANDSETNVAEHATQALIRIGPDALSELVSIMTNTASPRRPAVAEAIANLTNASPALPVLLQSVHDQDEMISVFAAVALVKVPSREALVLPALTNIFHDSRFMVRWGLLRTLAWQKPQEQVMVNVLALALNDPISDMRTEALHVFSDLARKPEVLLPAITNALSDPNPEVRRAATNALAKPVIRW